MDNIKATLPVNLYIEIIPTGETIVRQGEILHVYKVGKQATSAQYKFDLSGYGYLDLETFFRRVSVFSHRWVKVGIEK